MGEIRDPETAQIAMQSALTGHLVFTTVHANNVFDVIGRFMHMGVDTYSFVSALNGILAQRLVRMVCQQCAEPFVPHGACSRSRGLHADRRRPITFAPARGCGHCRGSGYRGRKAIGELLVLNDEIREAIIARVPVRQLKELALAAGARFMRDGRARSGAPGRDHARGGQSCHHYGVTRSAFSWRRAGSHWCGAAVD